MFVEVLIIFVVMFIVEILIISFGFDSDSVDCDFIKLFQSLFMNKFLLLIAV